MTFLPIVERELRVAARRSSTYWSRLSAAVVCILASAYLLSFSGVVPSELGMSLFRVLAWLSMLYCLVAGTRLTADSVSSERREGTLGLLFLTDLKGYDVVLGKLASSSVGSLYSLLAIFPVLGLSLLLGGVTAWQFWSTVLALLSALFFSLAAGMLASTLCENGRRAAALAFLFIVMVTLLPLILSGLVWYYLRPAAPSLWLVAFASPAAAITLLDPGMAMPSRLANAGYWICVGSSQIAGWACLGLSSLLVTRVWQDRARPPRRITSLTRQWTSGDAEGRKAYRRRLLDINPVCWLASRDRLKPAYVWTVLTIIGGVCLWSNLRHHRVWEEAGVYATLSVALQGLLKLWIGVVAVQRLADDHQSGALELLLSTPLPTRDIVHGQLLALQRQFGGPILAMLAADVLLCYVSIHTLYADRDITILLYAAHMVILVADTWTIAWLGSWMAVSTRDAQHAAGTTLFRVVFVPWVVFMILMALISVLEQRLDLEVTEIRMLAVWFIVALVNDVIHLVYASRRLNEEFRAIAARRFVPRAPGLLKRLFGTPGSQPGS